MGAQWGPHQPKTHFVRKNRLNSYALECFSEAESAPIRSVLKFCFDLDIRFFPNFSKKYFFGRSKDGDLIFSVKSQILKQFL